MTTYSSPSRSQKAEAGRGNRTPLAVTLLSLLLVALSLGYSVWNETPRGRLEGSVVLADYAGQPMPDCDVYLTPNHEESSPEQNRDEWKSRRATTDKNGHFMLRGVTAGAYTLSASSRYHSSDKSTLSILVEESRANSYTLKMTRTEPDIKIGDHQSTFTTNEKPFLPVQGYVAGPQTGTAKNEKTPRPVNPSGVKPRLTIRLWRTRLSDVLQSAGGADALQKIRDAYPDPVTNPPGDLLRPTAGQDARLVATTEVPVKAADREGFYVERVPLPQAAQKPGLYIAQFTHGKKSACSYVVVSDLALVAKRSTGEMLGYAVDVRTGEPIANADLRLYQGAKRLAAAVTNAQGTATLPTPSLGGENGLTAVAIRGQDEAVVGRVGSWDGENDSRVVHILTDRTVYRPGDTISYKGIARTRRVSPNGALNYDVPSSLPVMIEVRDPSGALVTRTNVTTNRAGSFWGEFATSPEGQTGSYNIVAHIGDNEYTSEAMIASYRKPEFTVTVTPTKARSVRGEPVEMTVSGTYYFGGPLAGQKVKYTVYRDADWAAEYGTDEVSDSDDQQDMRAYRGEAYANYYGESILDGETTLDENGKAIVVIPTKVRYPDPKQAEAHKDDEDKDKDKSENLPQAETYTLTATVTDESEREVEADGAARVSAGDVLVSVSPEGYVGEPSKATDVYVTVKNTDGKPSVQTPVSLAASFEQYDKKKKEYVTVPAGTFTGTTGPDGRAILPVTPPRTGEMTLKATVKDSKGRTVTSETPLWIASDRGDDLDTDYDDLSLLTDKRRYEPGETARVLVNTARTGQTILLTVEGERVYQTYYVPVTQKSTVVRVPVQGAWGPNVTLAACYVRDKKFASSETPLRVQMKTRELSVSIKPLEGEKYGPGDTVSYQIETRDKATGKPISTAFALSVVDESIYALRPDNPDALRAAFYPRRQNHVSTSYSFSVEYLGDVSKTEPIIEARRKFRDTAYWLPEAQTDASGQTTIRATLPDNLTTWRATVWAVSDQTAVGYGVSKIVSTKPFFVRLEKPRFVTGGDESRLLALVHNETGQDQTATVRLAAPNLTLTGGETRTVTVKAGAIGRAEWTMRAPDNYSGDVPLRLTAWTPNTGKQYTDGVETPLPVRAYGRTDYETFAGSLAPVAAATPETAGVLRLDPAAVGKETRLTVRITPSLRAALAPGLEYLIGFPYGCTEQTMSRFYPDLLVSRLGATAELKKKHNLPVLVRDGLARLSKLQHSDGGWGWWENDKNDPFMTAYVLTGLAEAQAQGYEIPDKLRAKGIEAAVALLKTAPVEERPFLLYALQRTGYDDKETGVLRTPFRSSAKRTGLNVELLPTEAIAYLVLLGKNTNQNYTLYWNELQRRAKVEGRLISWRAKSGAKKALPANSDRMATALGLRVLLALNPQDSRIPAVLRSLMQTRTDYYFGDTRDTAWVLTAFADYLRAYPSERATPSGRVSVKVNGETLKTVDLQTDARGENEIVLDLPTGSLKPGPNTFAVVRTGTGTGGTVFYAGALRQTIAAPSGQELPALDGQGIQIKREIVRVVPQKAGELWRIATEPVENGRFKQGDRLRVRLIVNVTRPANYVLIEDAFPSGAEVTERGTAEQEVDGENGFWYDHVDVRDDRIAFFARRLPVGKQVIEYNLRAQTPGVCRSLPTHLEAMYDASVRAESSGARVEVTQ